MAGNGTDPLAMSPPAGNGSAPGFGEAFSLDLNTGQASYAIDLTLPEGTAGWHPKLKLEYQQNGGVSPFGVGWQMPVRSIDRGLDFGAADTGAERVLGDGQELIETSPGEYRAQVESAFTRYRRDGEGWIVEERTGARHELGTSATHRVVDKGDPSRVVTWLLARSLDTSGNEIAYEWEQDEGWPYLTSVTYASYAARLTYEQRPDVWRNGRAGFLRTLARRCTGVELHVTTPGGDRLVRRWALGYQEAAFTGASLLESVQLASFGPATDGTGDVVRPAQRFRYSELDPTSWRARFVEHDADSPPPPLTEPDCVMTPLTEGALPGVLQARGGRFAYWPNDGAGGFAPGRPLTSVPATLGLRRSGLELLDIDGDGRIDLLVGVGGREPRGYYTHGERDGWERFVAYPPARQAVPPFELGAARLADTDGDGRVDALTSVGRAYALWRNEGEGGWAQPTVEAMGDGETGPDASLGDSGVRLADMTGDGLPDLVRVRSGGVEYWPNLASGRFGARVTMTGSPRLAALAAPETVQLIDVDGDGCADLVVVDGEGVRVWINRCGQGFAAPIVDALVPPPIAGTVLGASMRGRSGADLLWCARRSGRDAYVAYELDGIQPSLLVEVDNGAGLRSEIDYTSAAAQAALDQAQGVEPLRFLPFPLTVVAGTREHDIASGRTAESRYRYHDGYWDERTRSLQGFARVEKHELGDDSRPDRRTVFHFLVAQDREPGAGPEQAALNRMLARTELFQLDGGSLEQVAYHIEESDHALQVLDVAEDGRQRVFVSVARMAQRWTERTVDERVEEHSYDYDTDGNVVRETVRWLGTAGGAAVAELRRVHELEYAKDPARNLVDRLARVTQRDSDGKLLSELQRFYDGEGHVGLPLGSVGRGLPTRELEWVAKRADFEAHYAGMDRGELGYLDGQDADGEDAVFIARARRTYDAAGRVVGERSPSGTETSFAYDASGLFRASVQGPLGRTESSFDIVVGKPVQIVDADGSAVELRYDAQGRLTTVMLPGDTLALPSRAYEYDDSAIPNAVRISQRREHEQADTLDSVVYFDGSMKELQRRVTMEAGKIVVSELHTPNPWSDTAMQYEPTFATSLDYAPSVPDGRPARRFRYDAEGRPVRTIDFGGGVSTAVYRPFEIETADADDNDGSAENVARGQFGTPRLELLDAAHRRIAIVEQDATGALTTSFEPSALGDLLSVSDAAGVIARYTYDGPGNRLAIDHRDAGLRKLFYDAGGRTVRVLDAGGSDLRVSFDAADRIAVLSVDGAERERYVYDDLATNGFGRLHEVTYPGGSQRFAYNQRGQVVSHAYEVEGHTQPFIFQYEYDALGKQRRVTYPDGSAVDFEQYGNGMPRRVAGFVEEIEYDARMFVTRMAFANGVTTQVDYTAGPGRVSHQRTTSPAGVIDDQAFTYDAAMHLLSVEHAEPGGAGSVSYTYDPLYQLTRFVDERTPGHDVAYSYEGRRISANGERDVRLFYEDASHPGRVSRVEQKAASSPLAYDANGNITSLLGRTLTFGPKGELERVEHDRTTVDYRYDHRGHRIAKRVTQNVTVDETLFFGQLAELRGGALARYVVIGHTRVALVRQDSTRWIHTDPLGSATFFTDEAGARIARIAYQPFGNPYENGATAPQQVFALHEWDADAGLYFMQRRYYSPELARFVSPDPVYLHQPDRELDDPRTLELYTYVGNDPLDNVDPSGTSFWTVLGAIVGVIVAVVVAVIVVVAFACGIGFGILALVGVVGLVVGGYALASANQGNGFGDFMKGFLIGLNAGLNAIILTALGAPVLGLIVGVIGFLAAFDSVRQNSLYQGVLGWSSWFMPMSWLVNALGLVFFVINLILAGFTLNKVGALAITYIHVDWATGSLIMKGGALANANPIDTAYDMGNFVFVDSANTAPDDDVPHELGHTLSLGAFGSIVHLVGFVDEMGGIGGANAWTERMADSHSPRRRMEITAAGGTPDDTWG
jgi:RHS repeat-associated protein